MNSLYKFFDDNTLLKTKIKYIYQDLIKEYTVGNIKNKTEFLYLFRNKIEEMMKVFNKPYFNFIEAYGTPVSKDYNSMIYNALEDIKINLEECKNIDEALNTNFNDIEINDNLINNLTNYIWNFLLNIKDSVEEYSTENNINIIETFNKPISNTNTINVDYEDNVLTLPMSLNRTNSTPINISIENTNGFPGNTHLIDENKTEITFQGETSINGNLNDIVNSDYSDYFELEGFKVSQQILENTNYLGYSYKENISWLIDEDELYLVIKLTPTIIKSYNNIKIVPYIPDDKNYISCVLEKVLITDNGSKVKIMKLNRTFDKSISLNFESQNVNEVKLYFKQENNYKCNICHMYSLKNIYNDIYTNESKDEIYNRYDFYKPSLQCLGYKYNNKNGKIIYPSTDDNYTYNEKNIKDTIFNYPSTLSIYDNFKEVIEAFRYMIGIKHISLNYRTYEETGVFISDNYIFDNEIEEITLYAEEDIKDGENIKYFISFDDGISWNEIYCKDRAYNGPCNIKINSDIPIYERDDRESLFIDRLLDTKYFKLKIEMYRGSNESNSPILYNYRIKTKLVDGDECID